MAEGGSKGKEDEGAGGTGRETEKSKFVMMSLNFLIAMETMQTSVLGSP